MSELQLSPSGVKTHLAQYIKNCEAQITRGQRPTSLCIEGEAGIAKTSLTKQIFRDAGYKLHQINAAMIDDLGHLVGFPTKEYQIKLTDGSMQWVPAELAEDYISKGAVFTGRDQMAYADPHWLEALNPDDKFVLLLDDFTRGLPMVMQACMTLVEEYAYASWSLPKNSIIMLTTNPDNGEYSVSSLDPAQRTRMRYIKMRFEVESWAQWAESASLDGRCINFVLHNPELFKRKDGIGGGKEYNARSMTKFFNDIGCLSDFSKELTYVKECGDGAVGVEFTNHFITFINNKLDKLPNPKELLSQDSDKALAALTSICGNYKTKDSYNQATASIMASRIANYTIHGHEGSWGKADNQKVINMILHTSFSDDLKFYMARQFVTPAAKAQSSKLSYITLHPEILKMIMD